MKSILIVSSPLTVTTILKLKHTNSGNSPSPSYLAATRRSTPYSSSRVSSSSSSSSDKHNLQSACDVVREFYQGINGHDLTSVHDLIAHNCVYHDLIFPRPFRGRQEILAFFKKFNDSISPDLQFVIDDLSLQDSSAVGVIWHLEWKGKAFPFSKGCSFYRLDIVDGNRQIIYGRDSVEPVMKPGELALIAIRGVTWLLERFPLLADKLS